MTVNQLTGIVFNCGLKVHRTLGPGLLESVYEECLFYELSKHGLHLKRQVPIEVKYDGVILDAKLRADIAVNDKIILELKAVSELSPIHTAQLITYLKMTDMKLGVLINFNEELFKSGFRRVINGRL
ncbi:MAG: GxxExxY protein [bacterium]|nr:GxxExxY protein [bacterium]